MAQSLMTTMAASLKASANGLKIVDQARRKRGWSKKDQAWADLACTSTTTLGRFWGSIAIQSATFQSICDVVGIKDWENIAELEVPAEYKTASTRTQKRLVIELDADLENIPPDVLYTIIQTLSQMGNPVMKIVDIAEGSIKLSFEGSPESIESLKNIINSGELKKVLDIPIKKAYSVEGEDHTLTADRGNFKQLRSVLTTFLMNRSLPTSACQSEPPTQFELVGNTISILLCVVAALGGAVLSTAILTVSILDFPILVWKSAKTAVVGGGLFSIAVLAIFTLIGVTLWSVKNKETDYQSSETAASLNVYLLRTITPNIIFFFVAGVLAAAIACLLISAVIIGIVKTGGTDMSRSVLETLTLAKLRFFVFSRDLQIVAASAIGLSWIILAAEIILARLTLAVTLALFSKENRARASLVKRSIRRIILSAVIMIGIVLTGIFFGEISTSEVRAIQSATKSAARVESENASLPQSKVYIKSVTK